MAETDQTRTGFLWLSKNTFLPDLLTDSARSAWADHYVENVEREGTLDLSKARQLLRSPSIRYIVLPERIWGPNLEHLVKEIQNTRHGTEPIVLWSSPRGQELSRAWKFKAIEDDQIQIQEGIQKLIETENPMFSLKKWALGQYPVLSSDKRSLLERIAFITAGRLDSLCRSRGIRWRLFLARPRKNWPGKVPNPLFFQEDPFKGTESSESHEQHFTSQLDQARAALAPRVTQLLQIPNIRRRIIDWLVEDVENCYWVATKARLISAGDCDYGSWGRFSLIQPASKTQVKFSGATILTDLVPSLGEDHPDPFFSELFLRTSDYLKRYIPFKPSGEPSGDGGIHSWASNFLENYLYPIMERMTTTFQNFDLSVDHGNTVGIAAWGLFGLQMQLCAYLGCVAWHYALSGALSKQRSILFSPNGYFCREADRISFKATDFLSELIMANRRKHSSYRKA